MGTSVVSAAAVKANVVADAIKENNEKQGSFQNRVKYGIKHSINYKKTMLKDTFTTAAGVAASVGTAAAVAKSKTAQKLIMRGLEKVGTSNFVKNAVSTLKPLAEKVGPQLIKAGKWVGGLAPAAKVVLGAGLAVTAIASRIIRNKYLVKTGQIMKEQEVAAKLEKQEKQKAKELLG